MGEASAMMRLGLSAVAMLSFLSSLNHWYLSGSRPWGKSEQE
jgi:hypothetical protein